MIDTLRNWWTSHSLRDRWVIGLIAITTIIVVAWLGLWRPLSDALDGARESHAIAVERHAAIAARVREYEALRQGGPQRTAPSSGRLDLILSQSAAEQGFVLSRNDAMGEDQSAIAIPSATAPALLNWLGALEGQAILATELAIRPNANGTVALTATMRRAR
ncbi:MAG: type II secretion system protein GspM [Sphingopyxis sp.]